MSHASYHLTTRFLAGDAQEVLISRPQYRFHIRSDVFGFGVMLWAVAMGTKPWPGSSADEAARQHVGGRRLAQPDSPLADAGLWRIMQRCWAQRVMDRPSMAEVRDDLAARLGEVTAGPVTAAEPPLPPPAALAHVAAEAATEATGRDSGEQTSAEEEHKASQPAPPGPAAKEEKGASNDDGGMHREYSDASVPMQPATPAIQPTQASTPPPRRAPSFEQSAGAEGRSDNNDLQHSEESEERDYGDWQADQAAARRREGPHDEVAVQLVETSSPMPINGQEQTMLGAEGDADSDDADGDATSRDHGDWQATQAAATVARQTAVRELEVILAQERRARQATERLVQMQQQENSQLRQMLADAGIALPVQTPASQSGSRCR